MITITQNVQQIEVTISQSGNSYTVQPVLVQTGGRSLKETFIADQDQTEFELTDVPYDVEVTVDRVQQINGVDYTVALNVVTLTNGVEANTIVEIRKFY